MRHLTGKFLESRRVVSGPLASTRHCGFNGAFMVPLSNGTVAAVICSDGMGWDHVSVSLRDRCPTWAEMCEVKELFFDPHECVMQLHPPRADYFNNHPYCLHLWRPQSEGIPRPPAILVGMLDSQSRARGPETPRNAPAQSPGAFISPIWKELP